MEGQSRKAGAESDDQRGHWSVLEGHFGGVDSHFLAELKLKLDEFGDAGDRTESAQPGSEEENNYEVHHDNQQAHLKWRYKTFYTLECALMLSNPGLFDSSELATTVGKDVGVTTLQVSLLSNSQRQSLRDITTEVEEAPVMKVIDDLYHRKAIDGSVRRLCWATVRALYLKQSGREFEIPKPHRDH